MLNPTWNVYPTHGLLLHALVAGGRNMPAHAVGCVAFPAAVTHVTFLQLVPPPQVALHWPQGETVQCGFAQLGPAQSFDSSDPD